MVLLIILLFTIYLLISRVVLVAVKKHGYISDWVLVELVFVPYLFLPITLFVVGFTIVSNWLLRLFKLDKDEYGEFNH